MKQRAVRYAVEQCIQLQREAIDKFKPDIVVGVLVLCAAVLAPG